MMNYMNPFMQMSQQNQSTQQNANQPMTYTNTNKIYVNGEDDVRNRILPPNSDYVFLDNDKALLYQKIVDSKGQFEVKTFDVVPHEPQNDTKKENTDNSSTYVSKSEFDQLQAQIQGLQNELKKMTAAKPITTPTTTSQNIVPNVVPTQNTIVNKGDITYGTAS